MTDDVTRHRSNPAAVRRFNLPSGASTHHQAPGSLPGTPDSRQALPSVPGRLTVPLWHRLPPRQVKLLVSLRLKAFPPRDACLSAGMCSGRLPLDVERKKSRAAGRE